METPKVKSRFGSARRALLASAAALATVGLAKVTAPQIAEAADPNDLVLNTNNFTAGTTAVRRTGSSNGSAFYVTNNNGFGVEARSVNSYGVYGISDNGPGVVGLSGSNSDGVTGISASGTALRGDSNLNYAIFAQTQTGVAGYFQRQGASGYAVRTSGPVLIEGDFSATGMKSAIVPGADGELRRVFCVESPDSMFEDFGRDRVVNGRGRVRLDPDFRAIIRGDQYVIVLTPMADCKGLYVSDMDRDGFEVRELGGATSATPIPFSYRVAGKRKDVADDKRLERVKVKDLPTKPRDAQEILNEYRNRPR